MYCENRGIFLPESQRNLEGVIVHNIVYIYMFFMNNNFSYKNNCKNLFLSLV